MIKLFLISVFLVIIIISCGRRAFKKSTTTVPVLKTDLHEFAGALYPIKKDGKWGYLNNRMEMVLPARFLHGEDFSEGLAAVSDYVNEAGENTKELYGCIDSTGKLIVDYKYDKIFPFSDGLAAVVKDGKYGYINKAGMELIAAQYEDGSSFSEGLAVVKRNGKNGFIDRSGRMVIEPRFSRACWVSVFSEGLAPVYFGDDSAGYIDATGNLVIPAKFTYVSGFSEGLALVKPIGTHKYGYINKKGEMVIGPEYELSLPFSEGVATVKMSRPDGHTFFRIIDREGDTIADDLQYGFTGVFREGLAGVESFDHRWGFINKKGDEVIAPRFASVRLFKNGLSMIQTGSLFTNLHTAYIDKTGNMVVGD
jgi:hypothetical protein